MKSAFQRRGEYLENGLRRTDRRDYDPQLSHFARLFDCMP